VVASPRDVTYVRMIDKGPDPCEDSQVTPALEGPMHGAVVATRLGPLVPLAAGAQAEDEALEHPTQIDPPMPLGRGGIDFVEDRLDERPDLLRNFKRR
jgi:hypothetical protein